MMNIGDKFYYVTEKGKVFQVTLVRNAEGESSYGFEKKGNTYWLECNKKELDSKGVAEVWAFRTTGFISQDLNKCKRAWIDIFQAKKDDLLQDISDLDNKIKLLES